MENEKQNEVWTLVNGVSLVLFRRDLRLEDNHAFNAAVLQGNPIICLYVINKSMSIGEKHDDFRFQVLKNFAMSLDNKLFIEEDETIHVMRKMCKEYVIKDIFLNESFEPLLVQQTKEIQNCISAKLHLYSECSVDFHLIDKYRKRPYLKLNAFFNKLESSNLWIAPQYVDKPYRLVRPPSCPQEKLFRYLKKNNSSYLTQRKDALKALDQFILNESRHSAKNSNLSFYISHGLLTKREIVNKVQNSSIELKDKILNRRKIASSEFAHYHLKHFPSMVDSDLKACSFYKPAQNINMLYFQAWCSGNTGHYIVDVAMRELNATGFINNRLRLNAASFLINHLSLPWQLGEKYFREKLIDAEIAHNTSNWQYLAGTGQFAVNKKRRILNPHLQLKKFDPLGVHCLIYLPELSHLKQNGKTFSAFIKNNFTYKKPIVEINQTMKEK